ncbi:M1 family aminopeptidase [Flavobacterium sp.]|uniref:ABC transporter permease/M1 family aminopeptidase n=1 Tax=Flavobacterium sp. TaxID=239 RepID=UPI00120AD0B3|nr:M1 family aminopeptidase [Flavobacterium sp.]RZJ69506.1 MAG: hypothetical protein EOO49_16930 [Flavobacterium sp.]
MWKFLRYELRYWLRTPMVWIFTLIYALFAFGATASENIIIGGNPANIFKNAPFQIQNYFAIMSIIFLVLTTAFMNATANRDFETGMYQFVFSSPIKKRDYFFGKFLGAYIVSLIPMLGIVIGTLLAPPIAVAFDWTPAERFGPIYWTAFLQGFLAFGIPNVLISGTLIFGLAIIFRNTVVSFVGTVLMIVFYLVSGSFLGDLDTEWISNITDPFGTRPFALATKYLTIQEKNLSVIALEGDLLWNRLLWVSLAIVMLFAIYWKFSFDIKTRKTKIKKDKDVKIPMLSNAVFTPKSAGVFTFRSWLHLIRFETKAVIKNPVYITVMAIGFIILIVGFCTLTSSFGTKKYATTAMVANSIMDSYEIFFYGFIAFYTGVLVWKERDAKFNEIQDATPVISGMLFTSKLIAIFTSILLVMVVSIFLGICTQAIYGYTNFEIGLYFKELILIKMSGIFFLIVLSLLLHYLINNRYIAWVSFIAFTIMNNFIWGAFEISTNMVRFGARPVTRYSDMNGYGPFVPGLSWFSAYWFAFCALLLLVISMFYIRGKEEHFKNRWKNARFRFRQNRIAIAASLLIFALCGGFVYYNTQVLNTYDSEKEQENKYVAYEKNYKKFEGKIQPRYVSFDYNIDLTPEKREMQVAISAWVKNKSGEPIPQLHFTLPDISDDYQIAVPNSKINTDDRKSHYRIYDLAKPMQPGDSIQIKVSINKTSPGFENQVTFTKLTQNGTFFNSEDILPKFGYQREYEISDKNERAKLKLPKRQRRAKLDDNDLKARDNTYIGNDSDWVNVTTTISTSENQIAVAPGSLKKEWKANGKRYFKYQLDHKALNFYSFISADYEVARKKWNGIDLEVYYDKKHAYNVPNMLKAMQKSLEYYTKNFGPYYQKQCRIIEFPGYSSFAQAFPGTMPYSESVGFITDLTNVKQTDIDMVFYVVAHEMGHQWWAHQICGANMQGAEMLSESFAQYSALMVMEKEYGKDRMKKFLQYEMDNYLSGRSYESEGEQPIMKCENQQYIHYQKASIVMYYLKEMVGENQTNQALRNLLTQFGYKDAPYATSNFAVREFRKVTPDSLQYLISDLFENITLFSNRTMKASYEKKGNDYVVTLETRSEKFRADSIGNEKPIPISDYIDIAVFAKPKENEQFGKVLSRRRVKISKKDNVFQFNTKEEPFNAGIDPYNYLIDRVPEDNLKSLR